MKVALVAGESSGDVLGAGLIRAIRARRPDATFEGVAGPLMEAAGCEVIEPAESLAVMGLIEPLVHIPRLLRLRQQLRQRWSTNQPDVFVGIDAPDFNLGLEKRLRASGVPTVHYVSPSIWAWRSGRIKTIRKAADTVLCLLPFEKKLYDDASISAVFVGHPKADSAPINVDAAAAKAALGLTAKFVVAVLPGSRAGEIRRLCPILIDAAKLISDQLTDVQFITPVAAKSLRPAIEAEIDRADMQESFVIVDNESETAMSAADVVLLASGTAALESALLQKPTVAAYRVAGLTYAILIGLRLVRLQHYTLPNLLTDETLVEEFIQHEATADGIATAVLELLADPERRASIATRFAKLREELAQDTDQRAAAAVIELARSKRSQ